MNRVIFAMAFLAVGAVAADAGIIVCDDRLCREEKASTWPTAGHKAANRDATNRHVNTNGVRPELMDKVRSIQAACPGTHVISGYRHTFVAGTRRISLHASGRAVDVRGPYGCIYAQLAGWPGGYSTDVARVRHIHISLGGREDGLRFRHGGGRRHHRYASR